MRAKDNEFCKNCVNQTYPKDGCYARCKLNIITNPLDGDQCILRCQTVRLNGNQTSVFNIPVLPPYKCDYVFRPPKAIPPKLTVKTLWQNLSQCCASTARYIFDGNWIRFR